MIFLILTERNENFFPHFAFATSLRLRRPSDIQSSFFGEFSEKKNSFFGEFFG